jgi:hypothetical protein
MLVLSAALGWAATCSGVASEPRAAAQSGPAPRRFEPHPGRSAGVRFAGRLLEPRAPEAAEAGAAPPRATPPPAPTPEPERRSGEFVSLEREAAQLAREASLLEPDALEKRLAELPRAAGETEGERRRRLDEERERLLSREFLLQYRLAQLYRSAEYPPGFDLERDVVGPERQRIAELPAQDRELEIRHALESWQPGRASPRFEGAPDPALAWQIGLPEL